MDSSKVLLNFHNASEKEKSSDEFGLKIAKFIENTVNNGYYQRRNARFEKSRLFARGKQPMREFLDLLGIDGKNSYANLDMTAPAIAPKFVQVLYGNFMKRAEKPNVSAVDPISTKRKQKEKSDAKFRMDNADFINSLQQETGIQLEDPDAFTPEDINELELFFQQKKLPEEILFEKGISYVFGQNSLTKSQKRKLLEDLVECGVAATKTYALPSGQIKIRRVIPENLIYSFSERDDFADASWVGEIVSRKIVDIRKMYPNLDERELYDKIACKSKNFNQSVKWNDKYRYSVERPYDDWNVDVIEFCVISVDNVMYRTKTNKYGNLMAVDRKYSKPKYLGDGKELIEKELGVVYEGVYVRGTEVMLQWGVMKNMIKPSVPRELSDVYLPYSLFMYENLDLENRSLVHRMETSIRQMTLIHLKIQQLVARMRPSGVQVDVKNLKDVNLGQGVMSPLEIERIYDQTGNLYYSGLDDDGETRKAPPIQELPNVGNVQQIAQLINTYNFYLERLRDEIGINEYREGSTVDPKLGLGVMQQQIQSSNNATDFIYEAFLSIMEQTAIKTGLLLYDSVLYGGKAYREYLGEKDISGKYFDVSIEMLPDDVDRMFIENAIQTALSAGTLEFDDAFNIRRIAKENIKLAEMYLSRAKKMKQKEQMEIAQQNTQMNMQVQQASAHAKAQGDAQLEQLSGQNKAGIAQMEIAGKSNLSMQQFVHDALLKSFETGKPLPPSIQMLVDAYLNNIQPKEEMQEQAA